MACFEITTFHLIQPPSPHFLIHVYTSLALGRDLTNYVALLWAEVGQPSASECKSRSAVKLSESRLADCEIQETYIKF
jgi:hypothetical protein